MRPLRSTTFYPIGFAGRLAITGWSLVMDHRSPVSPAAQQVLKRPPLRFRDRVSPRAVGGLGLRPRRSSRQKTAVEVAIGAPTYRVLGPDRDRAAIPAVAEMTPRPPRAASPTQSLVSPLDAPPKPVCGTMTAGLVGCGAGAMSWPGSGVLNGVGDATALAPAVAVVAAVAPVAVAVVVASTVAVGC